MYSHPEFGLQVLLQAGGIFMLPSRIVVAHPESWDGSGYPYGLAQEAIPLSARIVAVVDAYDAMTSQRPNWEAFPDAEWAELVLLMRELCFAALKNKAEEPIGDKKDAHYR